MVPVPLYLTKVHCARSVSSSADFSRISARLAMWIVLLAAARGLTPHSELIGPRWLTTQPNVPNRLRRQVVGHGTAALLAIPIATEADDSTFRTVGSERPGNNYYFPMARYRYCPRILRAWIAVDELAVPALKTGDWEGMQIVTGQWLTPHHHRLLT